MIKLLILLLLTIYCNSFVNINKKIEKLSLNLFFPKREINYNPIIYKQYNQSKPTYTILSKYTSKIKSLIKDLHKNCVNYIYIDAKMFKRYEIDLIQKHYSINIYDENEPLIFLEDKEYIGGIFEMYEIIIRYDSIE